MGLSYACLFVGYVELSLFHCYTGTIPHLYLRNIDDCISAASCSHELLEQFINFTKNFHPNLKFTWTISDTFFSFLFLSVSISGDHLNTDIYLKSTDSCWYLDYTYSHPPFCKNVIPYFQFLRLHRICSQDGVFHSWTSQISSYFKDHNLPGLVIKHALNKHAFISCISSASALKPPPRNKNKDRVPLESSHTTPPTSTPSASFSATSANYNPTPQPKRYFPPQPYLPF
eukprot:g24574.t1